MPCISFAANKHNDMTDTIDTLDYKFGTEFTATVDGVESIVYLSIRCEGKDAGRRDHCYRYGRGTPTPHDIIPKEADVRILGLHKATRP